MPSYRYKAVEKSGRQALGGMEAVNEVDLKLRLKRMGLDLISANEVDRQTSIVATATKITRQDLINFCFDMEQMDRAGIPIIDGLRDLRDTLDNKRFREVLTVMAEDMDSGKTLSQCMPAAKFSRTMKTAWRRSQACYVKRIARPHMLSSTRWKKITVSKHCHMPPGRIASRCWIVRYASTTAVRVLSRPC